MVRVSDLAASFTFYCDLLGLKVIRRRDVPAGRFTLVFLATSEEAEAQVELTYNWDPRIYRWSKFWYRLCC